MEQYFLPLRDTRWLSTTTQVVLLSLLFTLSTLYGVWSHQETGLLFGYPYSLRLFFVPLYEELLFRGFLFGILLKKFSFPKSLLMTSVLFGLWHLKNIAILSQGELAYQVVYTGLFLGPLLAYVTYKTGSLWPAVLLHYLNNLLSVLSWDLIDLISG